MRVSDGYVRAETVDEAATAALRERMRSAPRPKATATAAPPATPQQVPASRPRQVPAAAIQPSANGGRPASPQPIRVAASPPAPSPAAGGALARVLRELQQAHGDAWSFEIVGHSAYGGSIEVVGQLRANGTTVRETAVATAARGRSRGELLEQAANESLSKCVETLLRNGN